MKKMDSTVYFKWVKARHDNLFTHPTFPRKWMGLWGSIRLLIFIANHG